MELDRIIAWVRQRFPLLTPDQLMQSKRPGVLLTFDDGMANTYRNALPVLEHYKAPAVWFVSTQHVLAPRNWLAFARDKALAFWSDVTKVPEEWAQELFDGMSEEQVAECAGHPLITIGSHSVSHPFLTRCDTDALYREIVDSRRHLETITRQPVDLFAYPSGDLNRRVAVAVCDAGYRAAFSLSPKGVGMPLYDIPRIGIYQANEKYLDAKLCGFPVDHWIP